MTNHDPTGFDNQESETEYPNPDTAGNGISREEFDDDDFASWPFEEDLDAVDLSEFADAFDDMNFDLEDDFDDEDDLAPSLEDIFPVNSRHRDHLNVAKQAARAAYTGGSKASGLAGTNTQEAIYELIHTLAATAVASKSQAEAERLIAAIVPLSLWIDPAGNRASWSALPALIQGAASVTGLLYKNPATRPQIKRMPRILMQTARQLTRGSGHWRPISHRLTARVLARQTAAILGGKDTRPARPQRRSRRIQAEHDDGDWWDGNGRGA